MPIWWSEPKPEEPPKEESVDATEQELILSEEDKRKAWRMLSLLDALRSQRADDPFSFDEITQLGVVAAGNHDLHSACAALRNGCALDQLVCIFT